MSENGEIYTAGKNFTLPPAVTAWTNSTSGSWSVPWYGEYLEQGDPGVLELLWHCLACVIPLCKSGNVVIVLHIN